MDGKVAFSLDGGRIKFPNLEQLVEFHKMNTGPLPTLLKDKQVQVCPTAALVNLSWQTKLRPHQTKNRLNIRCQTSFRPILDLIVAADRVV